MDKEKIKKALASLSLVGLITGITLMSTGCAKEEAKQEATQDTQVEAAADTTQADSTASCGQGSCGQ